jgi:hypothetical protein
MKSLLIIVVFSLVPVGAVHAQDAKEHTNPGFECGPYLPDGYMKTLLTYIEPPKWRPGLVQISVGAGTKLDLWSDGNHFKLWTNTISPADIDQFFSDLDKSCKLPADPHEAFGLLTIKWESADLSAEQFSKIHRALTNAFSRYAFGAQAFYPRNVLSVYLDYGSWHVEYETSYQHLEADIWSDPKFEANKPMLDWIHDLHKLAAEKFHRSFE